MYGNDDHPLTQRELNNTIAGWVTAGFLVAALRDFLQTWQIQIKPYVYVWLGVLCLLPALAFVPPFLSFPGWIALGCIWIVLATCWVITICVDWKQQIAVREVQYRQAYDEQALAEQRAAYQQEAARVADRQAGARETGQAVVDAMRQAYQETQQAPTAPSQASQRRRNVVDATALPPAPESPTGAPQRPTEPPPGPPAPMGSSTPTLWVPTYQGPRKELQRRETSLEGIWMNDYRGVDPEEL